MGDPDSGTEPLEPAPATLFGLQLLQSPQRASELVTAAVQVEQQREPLPLFRFIACLEHPGSLLQQEVFQFLVFGELRLQRRTAAPLLLPGIHHGGHPGVTFTDVGTQ